MRAGTLRHRVTIEQPVVAQDEHGQPIETWATFRKRVPAQVEGVSGSEGARGEQVLPTVTDLVRLRYLDGVTPRMRVVHDTRVLNIEQAIDPSGHRRELHLQCKEAV